MTRITEVSSVRLPQPRPWSEPITEEQFRAFVPDGLELFEGYLMGGPEDGNARVVELDGVGHFVPEEAPDQVEKHVRAFLDAMEVHAARPGRPTAG